MLISMKYEITINYESSSKPKTSKNIKDHPVDKLYNKKTCE